MSGKSYQELLADEARHWDEFEQDFVEKKGIIPWWVDLKNATPLSNNTNEGLDPIKEDWIRGKYKRMLLDNCKEGDYVLDIGCGSGWLSLELARRGCKVVAIDVSPYRVELGRKHYQKVKSQEGFTGTIDYRVGDIKDLRFEKPLDVIVAWDSLHHLPDLDNLLVQLKSNLKPAGLLVCYDHLGSKFIETLGKVRRIFITEKISAFEDVSQDEILEYIKKYFKIEKIKYKITAPFRLLAFFLFRYDALKFLIKPFVKADEFVANKTGILGREFVYIKSRKEN